MLIGIYYIGIKLKTTSLYKNTIFNLTNNNKLNIILTSIIRSIAVLFLGTLMFAIGKNSITTDRNFSYFKDIYVLTFNAFSPDKKDVIYYLNKFVVFLFIIFQYLSIFMIFVGIIASITDAIYQFKSKTEVKANEQQ